MTKKKKDIECQVHTWVREKGKKRYIRREKTEGEGGIGNRWREKRKEKNHIFRACPKGIEEDIPRSYLSPFFTLKPNILAQDQTTSLSYPLQIHCLGYVGLDPFLFWIQVNSGPYNIFLNFFFFFFWEQDRKIDVIMNPFLCFNRRMMQFVSSLWD